MIHKMNDREIQKARKNLPPDEAVWIPSDEEYYEMLREGDFEEGK